MFRTLSLALLLTGAALAAPAADVYRYVDAQGGIHYTDTWVPGSTLIKMDHRATSGGAPPPTTRTAQSQQATTPANKVAADLARQADERAVHADVAQAREDDCTKAKDSYDKAVRSRRIIKTDKDGQREYLSEADADAYRLQLRQDVQSACGTSAK
ncbi:MAG TPA: DUF4124 domain-containing protein [Steroidobacteraceae bacterium]|jgi:hypothetical protein|nr:DUF4124 domain-containing protein [Steroidobacteraceae bacterium]